jgi:hypothetical protein
MVTQHRKYMEYLSNASAYSSSTTTSLDAIIDTYYNTYSWLYTAYSGVYNVDTYLYIGNDGGPASSSPNVTVFWALQTDFGNNQGAHVGLQWASGTKKVNWGGYTPSHPEGIVVSSSNYAWETGTPYRLRVWRLGTSQTEVQWGAWIKNIWTGGETYLGTFNTDLTGLYIQDQVAWTETIYRTFDGTGVPFSQYDVESVFSYNAYHTDQIAGTFQMAHALADYAGSVPAPSPTEDRDVSWKFDNLWDGSWWHAVTQKFHTVRITPAQTYL